MIRDHSDSERKPADATWAILSIWAARVLLYASSHRQDNRYHRLSYTVRGALAGTGNYKTVLPTLEQVVCQMVVASGDLELAEGRPFCHDDLLQPFSHLAKKQNM